MIHIQKEKNLKNLTCQEPVRAGAFGSVAHLPHTCSPGSDTKKKKKKKLAKTKIWSQPRKYHRIQEGHVREQKDLKSLHLCNEKNDDERESAKWRGFPREHMRGYHEGLERPQVCWESESKKRGMNSQGPWPTGSVVIERLGRNLKVCFVFLLDSKCVPADVQKHCLATGLPACPFQF